SIVVAGNFYSNGLDLQGSAAWNLRVPDNSAAAPVFNTGSVSTATMWASAGGTHAIVFNASVKGAQGQGGFINAAAVSPTTNSVEKNNNCVDVTGTNNANIVFGRPEIKVATTRYDDVLEITFMDQFGLPMKIENSHGEIQTALSSVKAADGVELGGIWYNSHATGVRFIEAFEDVACTIPTTDAKTLLGNDLSTFFLRIDRSDSAFRWNTDATGLSAGRQASTAVNDIGSTDRGRAATSEQPSHRDTIVDISLIKGLLNAADGKTQVRAYGSDCYGATPFAAYTATLDGTRPVLIAVRTGQETHQGPTAGQLPVDSHNYFELEYSEAVGLGDLAAGSSYGNVRSGISFASTAEHGGDYTSDGTTAVLQGYLSLAGTVSRGAKPNVSGITPTQTANALSRADVTPERVRIHLAGWAEDGSSLNSAWTWYWPGWLEDLSQPAGAVVSLENNALLDGSGNPVEPSAGATSASSILSWSNGFASAKAPVTISSAEQAGQTYGIWDIWEPAVALSRNKSNWTVLYGEIVPLDFDNNTRIDRLEFHLIDNARYPLTAPPALDDMTARWASIRGWIVDDQAGDEKATSWFGLPDTRGGARPERQTSTGPLSVTSQTTGGIRDSSMTALALDSFLAWDAAVDSVGKTATASHNASFKSYVTSPLFQPAGSVDVPDDPYYAIVLRDTDTGYNWTSGSTLHLRYEAGGGITDLAGNRLKAITDIMTVQRVAPRFRLSLAVAGSSSRLLYMQFTKAVNIEPQGMIAGLTSQTEAELKDIFRFNPVQDLWVTKAEQVAGSTTRNEVMLTLNRQLSAADILAVTFGVRNIDTSDPVTGEKIPGSFIIDEAAATPLSPDESHRLSDLGLGVIEVNAATDGVHDVKDPLHPEIQAGTVDTPTSALGALRTFDGSGRLLDRDITVYSSLDPMLKGKTSYENLPVQLGYDVDPSTTYAPFIPITGRDPAIGTTWLPGILSGFNDKANAEARTITPFWNGGTTSLLRSFRIPGNDSEVKPGANLGFMFSLGGLYCLRATSPDDPRQFDLFRLGIDEVKQQRGSVTIQSNVIDPTKGERTAIQVVLPQAGTLTINIFTLDGDLVKKVFNDRQAAGSYTFFWDGRNLAGDAVARGVYFVRVVAQGIDEIRKVMVVR
ncbi:MAG: FlgD immunoglobulin-like domain containing protein, partial [Rectinemataceae bacterium]